MQLVLVVEVSSWLVLGLVCLGAALQAPQQQQHTARTPTAAQRNGSLPKLLLPCLSGSTCQSWRGSGVVLASIFGRKALSPCPDWSAVIGLHQQWNRLFPRITILIIHPSNTWISTRIACHWFYQRLP